MTSIRESVSYVQSLIGGRQPQVGIILGSGLGSLGEHITDAVSIPYSSIPGFPVSTAIGHKGALICGMLGGKCVLAMQGRFHYYEGYSMDLITLPVRVMSALGVQTLFVSNAAGGISGGFEIGDIMLITDHISFLPNPLIGPNRSEFGTRFPDMTCAYDSDLLQLARSIGAEMEITLKEGVYLSCSGPCYETPAEINYFRIIGADAVGMSTIPEVVVARHCAMTVFGVSVITDLVTEDMPEDYVTDGDEIVAVADKASGRMTLLFETMVERL